jgi:hypothetical protein
MDPEQPKPRKPRQKSLINHASLEGKDSPQALEARLLQLALQNRAPSVAKAAAEALLERKAPRQRNPDRGLTVEEALRIADIYERIFSDNAPVCSKCGGSMAE